MAEIQLLRSYNFRVCIYFNEKTKYEGLDKSRIVTKIEDKTNKNQVILYNPLEVLVD